MYFFENILEKYSDKNYFIRSKMQEKASIVARVSLGNRDKFIQYIDGKFQFMDGGFSNFIFGEKKIKELLCKVDYYDLFVLDKNQQPSSLLYVTSDGKISRNKLIEDYKKTKGIGRTYIDYGMLYDREYSFYGADGSEYIAVPRFYYERDELRKTERHKIIGTQEIKRNAESFIISISKKSHCELIQIIDNKPDYSNLEKITVEELAFLIEIENNRYGRSKDNYVQVNREVTPDKDSHIVMEYIKSFNICDDDSNEMKSLTDNYDTDNIEYGDEYASYLLVNYLNQKRLENETNAQFLLRNNSRSIKQFIEMDLNDYSSIMRMVLSNMHPAGDNQLMFSIYDNQGEVVISKIDKDSYVVSISHLEQNIERTQTYNLESLIKVLNYVDINGNELIPQKDRGQLVSTLKETHLSSMAKDVLQARYTDSPVISKKDSPIVKVFKGLAASNAVFLFRNMNTIHNVEFIYLQNMGNYVIMKTIECLKSSKSLYELNFKGFGGEKTTRFTEKEETGVIERDYYLIAETPDNRDSKSPDVEICSREMTTSQLRSYLNNLNWREWDIEFSGYTIENIDIKDGVRIEADKEVFRIARDGKISKEEKTEYIIENIYKKIFNDCGYKRNGFGVYGFSTLEKYKDEDGNIVSMTHDCFHILSEAKSKIPDSFDYYIVNIYYSHIKNKKLRLEDVAVTTNGPYEDIMLINNEQVSINRDWKNMLFICASDLYDNQKKLISVDDYFGSKHDEKMLAKDGIKSFIDLYKYCEQYKSSYDQVTGDQLFDSQYVNKKQAKTYNRVIKKIVEMNAVEFIKYAAQNDIVDEVV